MSIIGSNILAGASGQATGYNLNNSLRFRSSNSAYLTRTPGSASNRKTFTWSAWVKRGLLTSSVKVLFFADTGSSPLGGLYFTASDTIQWYDWVSPTDYGYATTAVYRDPSAWYHVVLAVDTTQATASNRIKLYVNGVQQTFNQNYGDMPQNYDTAINSTNPHYIGRETGLVGTTFDGYMTEINFIDGQALTPSSFGETSTTTGSWIPKKYTSTYGTNGFYLKFSDIATTSGSNAGLGKDFSGNGNYYNTNNISVTAGTTYDAMIDSPTLTSATVANYCVLNPLDTANTPTNANLTFPAPAAAWKVTRATFSIPETAKAYWEITISGTSSNNSSCGVDTGASSLTAQLGSASTGWTIIPPNTTGLTSATKYNNGTSTNVTLPSSSGTNDIYMFAVDRNATSIWVGINGNWVGTVGTSGQIFNNLPTTGNLFPAFCSYNVLIDVNFGQRPFSYTPPTGFNRLNTYNLPDSTIVKGNTVMDATLYTGTGASLSVTNAGAFKPDFVWVKGRSGATDHAWYDSVRGTTKQLESNTQTAETTEATGLTAFGTSGFTVGALAQMNTSAATYVGWQWQAGQGSTTTGTGTGGITSVTQSVNATAGFSIVTYTGSGSNGTVTHGLGVAPKMIIVRIRDGTTNNWRVYNSSLTSASYFLYLNGTQAEGSDSTLWNSTAPTSSVFSLGTNGDVNASTYNYVAYCWAEIAGFSKFGSYTGNGSTDGTFVYTGFRPSYILLKRTDAANVWLIGDSKRDGYNSANPSANKQLQAQATNAESNFDIDYLSNGFKLRNTDSYLNASGGTYIYMAFAENPLKFSNAR